MTETSEQVREVMSIVEAAEYLGLTRDTLYIYAQQNKVPGFKIGNRWRFRRSRLDAWMDKQAADSAKTVRTRYWTKKRVKATDWKIGPSDQNWPFSVYDPESGKVMGWCSTAEQASRIISDLKTYGMTDVS